MENATKALVIAATILIAVFILSVGVYVFAHYSEVARKNEQEKINQAIIQENTKFTKYQDGVKMEVHDIVTIVNLAKDYNEKNPDKPITIYLNNNQKLSERDYDDLITMLKSIGKERDTYSMEEIDYYSNDTMYIQNIYIRKN